MRDGRPDGREFRMDAKKIRQSNEYERISGMVSPDCDSDEDVQIDLLELFYRLLEKAQWIVASAALCAIIASLCTIFFITPLYTATSKLYVTNVSDSAINLSDLQMAHI